MAKYNDSIVRDRLRQFIEYKGISVRAFQLSANLSNSFVASIDQSIAHKTQIKIQKAFPELNMTWLLLGEGEMLRSSSIPPKKATESNVAIKQSDNTKSKVIPLLPISAQGGSLNDFSVSVMSHECEKVVSPMMDVDFAISISGDSMSPEYPSGCQVLIKKINDSAFIEWGKVYVLDTCNGTIIKKLMPSESPDKVLCVSINPAYPQFEVAFKYIQGIYRVMMVMAVK